MRPPGLRSLSGPGARLAVGLALLLGALLALAGVDGPRRVNAAVVTRLPALIEGEDTWADGRVEVCWEPVTGRAIEGYRVLAGPAEDPTAEYTVVAQVPATQRCWRGAWAADQGWAVAPVATDGVEGERVLARGSPLRDQGRQPVEARIEGDTVVGIAEADGRLWFATDGGGLTAARRELAGLPSDRPWTTWRRADGPSSDALRAVIAEGDAAIWVAADGAVARMDLRDETWRVYGVAEGLPTGRIGPLVFDGQGRLLAGGAGGAVYTFDAKDERWRAAVQGSPGGSPGDRLLGLGPDGLLWFSTADGLRAFDGSLPEEQRWLAPERPERALIMAVDPRGGAWFGTDGDGLLRRGPGGEWQAWREGDGLPDDRVTALLASPSSMLVGTAAGLARYELGSESWDSATSGEPGVDAAIVSLSELPVIALHRDRGGALWAAVRHQGLLRADPGGGTWSIRPAGVLRPGPLHAVASTRGQVWFAADGGVSRLTHGTGAWAWWRALGEGLRGPARALTVSGPEQALWVGAGGGVARYLPASDRWMPVTFADPSLEALALLPDYASLWVGTDRGLLRLDLASGAWDPDPRLERLKGVQVQALVRDSASALWIGTARGAFRLPASGPLETRPANGALSGLDITAIEEDGGGAIWFSTRQGLAVQYLPASGELRRHASGESAEIRAMARDYGRLWFATTRGLASWDASTPPGRLTSRVEVADARGVAVDGNGRVWIATDRGAVRWDPETGITRRFPAALLEPEQETRVLALTPAGSDRMWLGTGAGTVVLTDRSGAILARLDSRDGLPVAEVRALLRDDQGKLWIGMYGGGVVSVRQPEDTNAREITVLRGEEGPGSDAVGALFFGERDQICATTDKGASCFVPGVGWQALRVPRGLEGEVLSMHWGRDYRLWVGTTEGAGWRAQRGGDRQAVVKAGSALPASGVRAFWEDQAGELWLGLMNGGLARLDQARLTLEQLPLGDRDLDVRDIAEAAGRLWVATDRGVFTRVAPEPPPLGKARPTRPEQDAVVKSWRAETSLDLGPETLDVWSLAADDAQGLWLATSGGALRLDLATGSRIHVDPSAPRMSEAALLQGAEVGVPLAGAAALVIDGRLVGEPTNPSRLLAVAAGCGERDLLLEDGDVLRFPGESGSREVLMPPVEEPSTLAVICDEGGFSRAPVLCVGGERLRCRAMAGEWADVSLPRADRDARITALLAAPGGLLWIGHDDGMVCRSSMALGADTEPDCWQEGLPAARVHALAEDGEGGIWVGTDAGLGRVRRDEQGAYTPVEPPRPFRPQHEGEYRTALLPDLSGVAVPALTFDPDAAALWLSVSGQGVVRVGPPARRSFQRKSIPVVMMVEPAASLAPRGGVVGLAVDADHRLWLLQGGRLYDHDARSPPGSALRMALIGGCVGLFAIAAFWGSMHVSPAVRAWRKDPASVERIGMDDLGPALQVLRLYAPGFARATIGPARLGALERLSRVWRGPPERLLPAVAEVLTLEPRGEVEDGTLAVDIKVGLALKRPDTLLVLLPPTSDAEAALHDRLGAREFHELVPALVIWREDEPPALHGAVAITEADLRAVGWSRRPRRRLAGLIWQRSDMQGLSPYQAHGAVQDPRMFFGRDAVLRELMAAGRRRALLVIGPRRVGKTSVLLRAATELDRRGIRTLYVTLRATVAGPFDLAVALARAARVPPPEPPADPTPAAEAALLGSLVRAHMNGMNLLLDEADAFLRNDRARGSAASEELRALVQEGVCALALAGYGTLYRAALSQADTVYNLGEPLFLGPLERAAAIRLATEPMERMGIRWADSELPEHLVDAVGGLPHLVQDACRRLLLRVRGFREPEINSADLYAVLGDWRPEGEPSSLRELLISNVETNLKGPAQAAVWLLSNRRDETFALSRLGEVLTHAGFPDMDSERVIEVGLALQVAGICQRGADRFRFLVPLLGAAVADLDVNYRVTGLREAWVALDPGARRIFRFWGASEE